MAEASWCAGLSSTVPRRCGPAGKCAARASWQGPCEGVPCKVMDFGGKCRHPAGFSVSVTTLDFRGLIFWQIHLDIFFWKRRNTISKKSSNSHVNYLGGKARTHTSTHFELIQTEGEKKYKMEQSPHLNHMASVLEIRFQG